MHEYDFVSIAMHRRREGVALETDYRDVIRERALAGWIFVQAIPFETDANPRLDLVFTRKVRK